MQFLLDTHTLIWFFESDNRLSPRVKEIIQTSGNRSLLSVASIWEIVIKQNLGKLSLSRPISEIIQHVQQNGIAILNIEPAHALKVGELSDGHRDPFDRLLIAQSLCLNIPILSKDELFDQYPIQRIW